MPKKYTSVTSYMLKNNGTAGQQNYLFLFIYLTGKPWPQVSVDNSVEERENQILGYSHVNYASIYFLEAVKVYIRRTQTKNCPKVFK